MYIYVVYMKYILIFVDTLKQTKDEKFRNDNRKLH
jgi:hypothetical protein